MFEDSKQELLHHVGCDVVPPSFLSNEKHEYHKNAQSLFAGAQLAQLNKHFEISAINWFVFL